MSLSAKWPERVRHAVERLKDKFPEAILFDELMSYTVSTHASPEDLRALKTIIPNNSEVDGQQYKETGLFRYYPKYGISGPDDLLRVLKKEEFVGGLRVSDLKVVWPTAEDELTKLERQHKIVVTRNRKDGQAKHVWLNDPTMYTSLDDEFRDIWLQISVPDKERMRSELKDIGFKVATEAPKVNALQVQKKKKSSRRGQKITNVHMQAVLKDYSHKRPGAAK